MTKKTLGVLVGVLLVGVGMAGWWFWRNYLQVDQVNPVTLGQPIVVNNEATASPNSIEQNVTPSTTSVPYTLETVAENLSVPWSLVFTSPDRILITERPGKVRVIEKGRLLPTVLRQFSEVSTQAEEGLMGMVLDPDYAKNKHLYLCLAYERDGKTWDKVVRFTDEGQSLSQDTVIIDQIPAARFHAGCRLGFGPDGKLYVTTGDATQKQLAQDKNSLAGKILRLNADGSIPTDNPFPNSPVYSFGHRNPQGLAWHPVTGALIETEHGPSGNDGPGGGDEVNFIQAGANYGWPLVSHEKTLDGTVKPLLVFTPAVAPASGSFYSGNVFPQWRHNYFFGMLRGEGLVRVVFSEADQSKVLRYEKIAGVDVGRVRDVVEGPDGFVYFTTSNQDGRGKAKSGDDKLYRLVPQR